MLLPRRQFFHWAAGAAMLPTLARGARAQTYPTRPVHLIIGFAPGGMQDISSRVIGHWLSERLGQPVVIENRIGAGGNMATELVVKAPPDGYTLLLIGSGHAISTSLYDKVSFDFIRDVAPVAGITRAGFVMMVHPSVPATTVPEFIAYAKANPGKLNMASPGSGTAPHLAGELFKIMTGIDMVHVPYRGGGPALTDLIGGQVQVQFSAVPALEYIKAGRVRALAVTGTTRSSDLPDIPTVAEAVPGYEASAWFGIGAPRNTPAEIIDKLNREVNLGLADPKVQARLADFGGTAMALSPAAFAKLIVDETEKWGKVIRAAGAKPPG